MKCINTHTHIENTNRNIGWAINCRKIPFPSWRRLAKQNNLISYSLNMQIDLVHKTGQNEQTKCVLQLAPNRVKRSTFCIANKITSRVDREECTSGGKLLSSDLLWKHHYQYEMKTLKNLHFVFTLFFSVMR